MARIVWHQGGARKYELGVDRGVFYDSTNTGYVWNGLVSVEESSVGGDIQSYHFDGIKYLDHVEPRNYQAVVSAFAAPANFGEAVGEVPVIPGFILTRQDRTLFGLTYRTEIYNPDGYKIHLVYNALATQTEGTGTTISDDASTDISSWQIDAVPLIGKTYRPTAHFILDSTKMPPSTLNLLEDILYGTETTIPYLPSIDELRDLLLAVRGPRNIIPQIVSGLAELVPGEDDLYNSGIEGLYRAVTGTSLIPSSIPGLYELEE